ncbi:MAG: F0F1 ATP synthase subunit A [Oscillospiraceae bacterium]|jgi:F-type H+-transporting ATPase subunit a|nr:F0F1 ATP synthase subunit A [Oscillospiraceae bacterium]
MNTRDFVSLGLSLVLVAAGVLLRRLWARRLTATPTKKQRFTKRFFGLLALLGGWWFVVKVIALLYRNSAGKEKEAFHVSIFPERTPIQLFGWHYSLSNTVLITWVILAFVLVLGLVFRLFVVPRMKDQPGGLQLALEAAVEQLDAYIGTKLHGASLSFGAYIFSLAILLVSSALVELLGLHAPTADITMTLALSLITFVLINYYGFRQKGFWGRMKSMASIRDPEIPAGASRAERLRRKFKSVCSPTTIGFPFRLISDLVVPLSLTCRLFGNMFGGMIIIDLLYYAMGNFAVGLPSVAGLYFNIFHPLIQAFIFITLTLSYIEEATASEN